MFVLLRADLSYIVVLIPALLYLLVLIVTMAAEKRYFRRVINAARTSDSSAQRLLDDWQARFDARYPPERRVSPAEYNAVRRAYFRGEASLDALEAAERGCPEYRARMAASRRGAYPLTPQTPFGAPPYVPPPSPEGMIRKRLGI